MSLNANIFDDMPARPEFDLIQEWIQETPHLTEFMVEPENSPWIIGAIVVFVIGMGGYIVFNRFGTRTEVEPEVPLGFRNKIMNGFQDFIGGIRRGYNTAI